MRTIEMTATVTPEHTLTLQLPPDIPPGDCRVVVVIENGKADGKPPVLPWAGWTPHSVGLVDPNFTFRREDLYGDGDR
jgi:hypothetical protein